MGAINCHILHLDPAVYFTEGRADVEPWERNAIRDAAATVIVEEKMQAQNDD